MKCKESGAITTLVCMFELQTSLTLVMSNFILLLSKFAANNQWSWLQNQTESNFSFGLMTEGAILTSQIPLHPNETFLKLY